MPFRSERQRRWFFANKGRISYSPRKEDTREESPEETASQRIVTKERVFDTSMKLTSIFVPHFNVVYVSYKTIHMGVKLYNLCEQLQNRGKISEEQLNALVKESASIGTRKITESLASSASEKIIESVKEKGFVDEISKETGVDKEIYSLMLKGTVRGQMVSGIEDLISYVI